MKNTGSKKSRVRVSLSKVVDLNRLCSDTDVASHVHFGSICGSVAEHDLNIIGWESSSF